ncbi:MAG: DUF3098 domain-containing protein [Bacteroidota bacterium]|nr:DUF3098 domain-containing protein [Bacteroidota bacterium]MED5269404.1 DUF3098 domain-containing protein [Bacteroidota bacterium]|tara:strand:+ start:382 stop:618 length:237 start_codon:yes stop_codon:yes gene_type:complete
MDNKERNKKFLFGSKNYKLLLISIVILLIGFILMSGGGSDDPSRFNSEIYNFRRIRLAPTLIIIGFLFSVFSILKRNK